jgi:predicted nucleotidyltransferase
MVTWKGYPVDPFRDTPSHVDMMRCRLATFLSYLSGMLSDLINKQRSSFVELCRAARVKELYAFGSAVNGPFTEHSDVDLLVEVEGGDPTETGERLWTFWDRMEAFFQRPVDLLTPLSLQNPVKKRHIDATKQLIYDGSSGRLVC